MVKLRPLDVLFHIVKEHHMYFSEKGSTIYMCHAAEYARKDGNISKEECDYFEDACMELVHSYHKDSDSLVNALMEMGVLNVNSTIPHTLKLIESIWINFFTSQG